MIKISVLKFYNSIEDKSKFKLVNGLFIVRYKDETTSEHIADLDKGYIYMNENEHKQLFRKEKNKVLTHTRMDIQEKYPSINFWKELTIKFIETPIEDILK